MGCRWRMGGGKEKRVWDQGGEGGLGVERREGRREKSGSERRGPQMGPAKGAPGLEGGSGERGTQDADGACR